METNKPKASEAKKIATKAEDKKKTKKDDVMNNSGQKFTIIKGHLKIIEGLRPGKQSIEISENTKRMETQRKDKKVMKLIQNTEDSFVHKMKNKKVWDCESTLYDSFELNSFNRQLDSAISSSARSMSMPHLPPPPPPPPPTLLSETTSSSSQKKQPSNKISRSLQKLIKSIFRQKQSNTPFKECKSDVDMDKYYVVFDNMGSLTTIPESRESIELAGSSEINSLDRKTVSERFPPSRLTGISCS